MPDDNQPVLRRRFARSRFWSIYVPNGNRKGIWVSARTTDEIEAMRFLDHFKRLGLKDAQDAMRADAMGRVFLRKLMGGRNVTIRRSIDDYSATIIMRGYSDRTVSTAIGALNVWAREMQVALKGTSLITADDVSPWINPRSSLHYVSRMNRHTTLNSFFEWCVADNRMPINLCQNIRVKTSLVPQDKLVSKKRVPFTDEEVAALLATIPRADMWHGIVLLGKYFGLRIGAATSLEWSSLPELKRIRVFTHKGRVVVDEPLPDELAQWFADWPDQSHSGLCFPRQASNPNYAREFRQWCRLAGIGETKSFHCLRVRAVTNGINAVIAKLGGEERAMMSSLLVTHGVAGVQKIVGHVAGSVLTTTRYFNPAGVTR